jgi:hypothetical protein
LNAGHSVADVDDAVGVAVGVAAGVVAERLANDEARASGRSPKLFNTSGWVAVRVAFSGQEAEMPRIYSELQSLFVSDISGPNFHYPVEITRKTRIDGAIGVPAKVG